MEVLVKNIEAAGRTLWHKVGGPHGCLMHCVLHHTESPHRRHEIMPEKSQGGRERRVGEEEKEDGDDGRRRERKEDFEKGEEGDGGAAGRGKLLVDLHCQLGKIENHCGNRSLGRILEGFLDWINEDNQTSKGRLQAEDGSPCVLLGSSPSLCVCHGHTASKPPLWPSPVS